MRVSASAQRSTAAETMHGPSSATRRKAPSASAMDPEHSSESDRRVSVAAQLSSERGRVRLLDRAACVLGGRWCAANLRAPLSPPEGSSPPRELRPSMKLESRSSPCGYGAERVPSARSACWDHDAGGGCAGPCCGIWHSCAPKADDDRRQALECHQVPRRGCGTRQGGVPQACSLAWDKARTW